MAPINGHVISGPSGPVPTPSFGRACFALLNQAGDRMADIYAHSFGDETVPSVRWQKLADHLRGVARLARQFAEQARPGDANFAKTAELAGLLHDLGKYRPEFQQMLRGLHPRNEHTRHKQAGAAQAADGKRLDLAFAIAGHHGGIPNFVELKDLVRGPNGQAVAQAVWSAAVADCSEVGQLFPAWPHGNDRILHDVLARLLFSCLVDADWQDTGEHERRASGLSPEPEPPVLDAQSRLENVLRYIQTRSITCPDQSIAKIRQDIHEASLKAAVLPPGLFSLTVPTGGGKTLSGLAFALQHALAHGLRRVIYAAPYLTIIEQNAREIRRALGVDADSTFVFEHHSLSEPGAGIPQEVQSSAAARRAESWDAPVIVTTNVQFFESLFSNQPGQCRKLHNIARSVIVLDECQTLRPDVVAPTCSMLAQLAEVLSCTVVLCTATQPAWTQRPDFPDGLVEVREIVPERLDLFHRLRRVRLHWPESRDETLDWAQVAKQMRREQSALCIVNTRKAARDLFAELRNQGVRDALHLSTTMCPAHRMQVLDEVRRRLIAKEPCHLVSTQLIECGCDVDFPLVLREMAPLEAIIQSAGRCNREGVLNGIDGSPGGRTRVFRTRESSLPPDRWYRAGRDVVEQDFLAANRMPDIGEPCDIRNYFLRLYRTGEMDQRNIQDHRRQSRFATVAEEYRIIDAETIPVVVTTWPSHEGQVNSLIEQLRRNENRVNRRKIAPFQVNLRHYELDRYAGCWLDDPVGLKLWTGVYDAELGVSPGNSDAILIV